MDLDQEVRALAKRWGVVSPGISVWREVKALVRMVGYASIERTYVVNISDGRCPRALAQTKANREGYTVLRIISVKEV